MTDRARIEKIVLNLQADIEKLFSEKGAESILFGSYARGDADSGSDIDVLILVQAAREAIAEKNWLVGEIAAEYLFDYNMVVSPIVENKDYFQRNLDVLPLFAVINREGVKISA